MDTKKYDFYLASGWFSENQEKARMDILEVSADLGLKIFSPKDEKICPEDAGGNFAQAVFEGNINAIMDSKFLVVNTTEKDMGTIFEAGYANAKDVSIIYYCPGLKGNFNLMLARTAKAVATDKAELKHFIRNLIRDKDYYVEYKGKIE